MYDVAICVHQFASNWWARTCCKPSILAKAAALLIYLLLVYCGSTRSLLPRHHYCSQTLSIMLRRVLEDILPLGLPWWPYILVKLLEFMWTSLRLSLRAKPIWLCLRLSTVSLSFFSAQCLDFLRHNLYSHMRHLSAIAWDGPHLPQLTLSGWFRPPTYAVLHHWICHSMLICVPPFLIRFYTSVTGFDLILEQGQIWVAK